MDCITPNELKAVDMLTNKTAEKTTIGILLTEPDTQTILDTMPISLFTDIEQTIIKAFKNAHKKVECVTLIELMEELKKDNSNVDISTLSNLTSYVTESTLLKSQLTNNLKILSDLMHKRKYFEYLKKATEKVLSGSELEEQVFDLIDKLEGLKTNNDINNSESVSDIIAEIFNDLQEGNENLIKFGYSLLDNNIGGVKPGDYTIIGAKSGVGKSTLAMNIAYNVLKQGGKVLYINREMSKKSVMCRFIAMLSEIPMIKFRTKEIADNERDSRKFVRAANILNTFDGKLIIDNDSSCISEIVKNVREFKPDLVVIDYLQLLQSEEGQKHENSEQRLSNVTRGIRNMTLKYNCHVLALVQLNNSFNGVMPHGENVIRQSSSVYQDATNVIYLHDPQDIEQMKRIHNSIGGIDDNAAAKMLERNLKRDGASKYAFILDKVRDGAPGIEPLTFIRNNFRMLDNEGLKNI